MAPRRVDSKEKSERILEAATRVFAQKGYGKARIDEIASLAGIGKGTVYEYFDSKEELFFGVFHRYNEKMLAAVGLQMKHSEGSAIQKLSAMARSVLIQFEELEPLIPLTFEFWAASGSGSLKQRERIAELFRHVYGEFRDLAASIIRQGINDGEFAAGTDPDKVAAVLVGSFDGLFLQAWFDPEVHPLDFGESFLGVLGRGLAAGERPAAGEKE